MTELLRALRAAGDPLAAAAVIAVQEIGDVVDQLPALGGVQTAAIITLLIGTAARLIMSDRKDRRIDNRWQAIADAEKERAAEAEERALDAEGRARDALEEAARYRATLISMGVDPGATE